MRTRTRTTGRVLAAAAVPAALVAAALSAALVALVPVAAAAQPAVRSGTRAGVRATAPAGIAHLPSPRAGVPAKVEYANDHVLVRFRTGTSASAQARALSAEGTAVVDGLRGGYVSVAAPKGATAQLAGLRKDPTVAWAGYDIVRHAEATNDPLYVDQAEYLHAMHLDQAWARSKGSLSQVVAVVDTGVNAANPDLAGRVLAGYDFVNLDTNAADDNGHGTFVAGVAAAGTNNGIGIAGAAYTARVLPVKVLDSGGSGLDSTIADGIRWAADHGATVINLSLGGPGGSSVLHDAVAYAVGRGIPVVAAAGNTGDDTPQFPGADPDVISVAATDSSDQVTAFSTFGDWVDLAAPGFDIVGTYGAGYAIGSGTSFSSPLVAGTVALLRTVNPTWTPAQILRRLEDSATDAGPPGLDPYTGYGVVNADAALGGYRTASSCLSDPSTQDTPTGVVSQPGQASIDCPGDVDWFVQSGPAPTAGQGWTFTVTPGNFPAAAIRLDPVLSVYDSSLHLLGTSSTQTDAAGDVHLSLVMPAGPAYVEVSNANGGPSAEYTVSAVATGSSGTPVAAGPLVWVADSSPQPRAGTAATGTAPSVTFGRAMDATTLDTSTVVLVDGLSGQSVPGSVAYAAGTHVLTFTPSAPLLQGVAYDLTVTGAKDVPGNVMPELRLPFLVAPAIQPPPPTGLTAGGTDGSVTLRWTLPYQQDMAAAIIRYAVGDTPPDSVTGTLLASGFRNSLTVTGLGNGQDYSFSVFSETVGSRFSATAATVVVKGSSDLLTVTPASTVYLKPVTITGTLRDAGTLAPEPGRNVALYWRRAGTTAWTLITVTQTDANGQVTATTAPPWDAQFYLHDLGGTARLGGEVTVSHPVTFDVSSRVSASTVTHGATVTLTGVVLPARTGSTVLLENYYGGAWHITATGVLNIHSAHAFAVTLRTPATYTFRFVKAGETLLGTGVSPTFTVRAV